MVGIRHSQNSKPNIANFFMSVVCFTMMRDA